MTRQEFKGETPLVSQWLLSHRYRHRNGSLVSSLVNVVSETSSPLKATSVFSWGWRQSRGIPVTVVSTVKQDSSLFPSQSFFMYSLVKTSSDRFIKEGIVVYIPDWHEDTLDYRSFWDTCVGAEIEGKTKEIEEEDDTSCSLLFFR